MKDEETVHIFNEFLAGFDKVSSDKIWADHNKAFKAFWNDKIMNRDVKELNDAELDEVIRILDRNAKGNRKGDQAVARAMISQGTWRRMFKEIKGNARLSDMLNHIFTENSDSDKQTRIDALYKMNEGRKNGLTGQNANALNAMLGAYDPSKYLHIISLADRHRLIDILGFSAGPDFDKDGSGRKIILSNRAILDGFRALGIETNPRTLSRFVYESPFRQLWKPANEPTAGTGPLFEDLQPEEKPDISRFYMESQLEDFLIENWDKTELGKEYDLIEEGGDLVSQQYRTGIGKIDILAQDKKTKQYVVIELKKDQTSDDTVGQLTRYMGWLEENKTKGKPTKGIIIAAAYDQRLYYALKKVKDVEIYLYRVSFKLEEFKKPEFKTN